MELAASLVMAAVVVGFIVAIMVRLRGRHRPGNAAAGAVYDLLIEDRRKAIEIILEERAEATDPETKDGDLPQLKDPKKR